MSRAAVLHLLTTRPEPVRDKGEPRLRNERRLFPELGNCPARTKKKKKGREEAFRRPPSSLSRYLSLSLLPTKKTTQSIAPTAEEEEELNACDAWVAALVDAEIADEQQEAFHLESEQRSSTAVSPLASAVSVH